MAFSDAQRRALKAKLRHRHVRMRAGSGATLAYVEGWHVIAEANRIFGHDAWDRQTLAPRCVWRQTQRGETTCFYSTKVRITVRAGDVSIVREGIGTGTGRGETEMAHEIAIKAAETDATKRALATFGNPFGLALYDKDKRGVTRPPRPARGTKPAQRLLPAPAPLLLHRPDGRVTVHDTAAALVAAALAILAALPSAADVGAFWEANRETFAALPRWAPEGNRPPAGVIGAAVRARLRALRDERTPSAATTSSTPIAMDAQPPATTCLDPIPPADAAAPPRAPATTAAIPADAPPTCAPRRQRPDGQDGVDEFQDEDVPIDGAPPTPLDAVGDGITDAPLEGPGTLLIPKDKRLRDKDHLAFVASQPCLVCGRRPAQAHHIRFAQARAFGLKVSDEFVVPLCNGHHDSLHQTGDERAWWARHGILDPLMLANRLWAASHPERFGRSPSIAAVGEPQPFEAEFDDISAPSGRLAGRSRIRP